MTQSKLEEASGSRVELELKDGSTVTGRLVGIRSSQVAVELPDGTYKNIPLNRIVGMEIR